MTTLTAAGGKLSIRVVWDVEGGPPWTGNGAPDPHRRADPRGVHGGGLGGGEEAPAAAQEQQLNVCRA